MQSCQTCPAPRQVPHPRVTAPLRESRGDIVLPTASALTKPRALRTRPPATPASDQDPDEGAAPLRARSSWPRHK